MIMGKMSLFLKLGLVGIAMFGSPAKAKGGGEAVADATEAGLDAKRNAVETRFLLGQQVTFPNPCLSLPAGRVPTINTTILANEGWSLVDFCLEGATGFNPAQPPDCHQNDDDSSSEELSFTFKLFTDTYNKSFINNKGTLSFGSLFSDFNPTAFPINGVRLVAPFWADIDTRSNHGYVWRRAVGSNKFAVAWESVGYFDQQGDKRNTFQVLISDGNDPTMGMGNNVCYCYGDMQWTGSDSNGGTGGFGGSPATVGVNRGNGIDSFTIGRYDKAGTADPMGVDNLDGQHICFSASGLNTPPIAVGVPENNRVDLSCDETITNRVITFFAPESNQTTKVTVAGVPVSNGLTVVIANSVFANTATATINWTPKAAAQVVLTFTAVDSLNATTVVILTLASLGPCRPPVARCKNAIFNANSNCTATPSLQDLTNAINNNSSDPNPGDNITTFSFDNTGPFGLGFTLVTMTVSDGKDGSDSCVASVNVIDNQKPVPLCVQGPNPRGDVPPFNNIDRYWTISASDNCQQADSNFKFVVRDTGSGRAFPGPFNSSGTNIKYTKFRLLPPTQKSARGAVDYDLTGKGDYLLLEATDGKGNTASVDCK